mmetsp:Transcript_23232/g.41956  ORF Transcript_23232/g.41956 Transcript_23232/m.41956 type:complete len:430 (-) Transcript_23232:44-1333(-)
MGQQTVAATALTLKDRNGSLVGSSVPFSTLSRDPKRSLRDLMIQAFGSAWFMLRMMGRLLWAMRASVSWTFLVFRLLVYVMLLLPAFLQATAHCWLHPSVENNVRYGPKRRHLVDVYKLRPGWRSGEARPVVVFMTGGVWIIGYKMWGFLMGMLMQRLGILFIAPDYRNFPQVTASDMVEDTVAAVQWCIDNCAAYGGDPNRIFLVGQSAGAHLLAQALLQKCVEGPKAKHSWQPQDVRAYVGISGPFDLLGLAEHFHTRGLDRRVLSSIFEAKLAAFSPTSTAKAWLEQRRKMEEAHEPLPASKLPPVLLVHGTGDVSVPAENAVELAEALQAAGARTVGLKLYEGKSHTDPIIEDPMSGDDPLIEDLAYLVLSSCATKAVKELGMSGRHDGPKTELDLKKKELFPLPVGRQMLPLRLINLARKVTPF